MAETAEHTQTSPTEHAEEHHGATPAQYVKVAIVLAVVTALEVSVIYVEALRPLWAPLLLSMMAFKFVMVALWFMHLKFDSWVLRALFMIGIILAPLVYLVVLLTFGLLVS